MRIWQLFIAVGAASLLAAGQTRAGIYSTIEPKWTLNPDYFRVFQEKTLTPLKQIASPEAREPWQKLYELAANAALDEKQPPPQAEPDPVPVTDRLNLAICLLRVRYPGKDMPNKAVAILRAASLRDKKSFLLMSTLGTAYQITGDYKNAADFLSEARGYWRLPFDQFDKDLKKKLTDSYGWSKEDFAWFARCEEFQLKLVKLRWAEKLTGPLTFDKAMRQIDALFEPGPLPKGKSPLQFFTNEDGKFEPGKIAAANKAKLPADAIKIVQQLLVWTPDDLRLFWLLGELLNAQGDVDNAKIVFDEFFGKYLQSPGVQNLGKIDDVKDLVEKFVQDFPTVGQRFVALRDYRPPIVEAIPLPADLKSDTKTSIDNPQPDGPEIAPLKLDWKTLAVGFGGGTLAGFLIAWRVRDALRRRQANR